MKPCRRYPEHLERLMSWWYAVLARHRLALTLILLLMAGVTSLLSMHIDWQANVLRFFSTNSSAVGNVASAIHGTGLVNRIRLDVHLAGRANTAKLAQAASALAEELRKTGDFRRVWAGVRAGKLISAQQHLLELGPALLSGQELPALERRVNPAFIQKRFAAVARRLGQPDGELLLARLVDDPLNMRKLLRRQLRSLNPTTGSHFSHGLLLAGDNAHAMMVLAPNFPPSNTPASIRMIGQMRQAIATVRRQCPGLRVWAVGSYLHYGENAQSIRRQVTWISLVGTLLVGGAILLFFGRWSTLVICMLPPVVGLGTALGLAGMFHAHLPLLVLGFAGLLCGSTTDYGIQLLAALNRRAVEEKQWRPELVGQATGDLFGAISMSVCTSVTGYAALSISSAPGLRELGLFIAGATLCIWLVTFLVLPGYFGPWLIRPVRMGLPVLLSRISRGSRVLFYLGFIGFLAVCLWMVASAARVSYNHRPRGLDDITPQTRLDEAQFARVWGTANPQGVLLIQGKSAGQALLRLHEVTQSLMNLQRKGLIGRCYSPASLLPDSATVQRRLGAWRAFWTAARQKQMRQAIAHFARSAGMHPSAWNPWLRALARPRPVPPVAVRVAQSPVALLPGMIEQKAHRTTLAIAVTQNSRLPQSRRGEWVSVLRRQFPHLSIIDGEVMLAKATDRAESETRRLFPCVFMLIVLPLWLYFRRLDLAALACLSMIIGFVWLLGAAQQFCGGLNLMSMVPILFTMGVAVDYGIYAAGDPRQQHPDGRPDRRWATMLCALTTISGTGVLAVSGEPALRWIGITLVWGIAGGYFTSLFLVGPITGWIFRRRFTRVDGRPG